MNQQILTLLPGGPQQDRSLGFEARSAEVTNLTSSYLRLPDCPPDIPPWVYGAVRALPPGIRQARAVLVPVTPAIPGPPVPVSQATLTWSDLLLPPTPGHLLQQVTTGQGNEIAVLVSPGNSTGSITLPAGTQSLAIVTQITSGDTSSMSLTGASSGFVYYSQALGSSAFEIIGVQAAVDTVLNYVVGHGSGGGVSFFITALPFVPPSFIQRTPAPWQVPTTITPLNQGIAHGTSFDWVTPPAGRSLRIFTAWAHWDTSTAGFGTIKGSGTTGGLQNYDQKATNFLQLNYGGKILTPGEKLQISNDDVGNGQNINGYVATSLD